MTRTRWLELSLAAYSAASFVHFAHNALDLREYPHMPVWLTATGVSVAWCVQAAVGLLGYWLYRRASPVAGALMMTVYGALGFAGLDHYVIAPILAHTLVMHVTIVAEATTAVVFLWSVARDYYGTNSSAGSHRAVNHKESILIGQPDV